MTFRLYTVNTFLDLPFFRDYFIYVLFSLLFSPSARLRVVPHFSSGIVGRAKRERAWKSPHARKGDTRRGERKMRDYRQSPSFWPFTADWFWSVKFVSRSKSIKRIQWDSFSHWAVIALVIGKLQGIFIASERKARHKFFAAVSREELMNGWNAEEVSWKTFKKAKLQWLLSCLWM